MRWLRFAAMLGAFFAARAARACTVCDSPAGRQLRAGLFDGHFLHTLLVVLAPAPVLLAAVLVVHFAMPDLAETPSDETEPGPERALSAVELPA